MGMNKPTDGQRRNMHRFWLTFVAGPIIAYIVIRVLFAAFSG